MSVLLEVRGLSFTYGGQGELLRDINFALSRGEIVGIMGDSGCGKTTLLNCLAGIIPHIYGGELHGRVLLKGEDISEMKLRDIAARLGVLFQNPDTQLFSSAIEDDIVFGPENLCFKWREIDDSLERSLKATGITEKRLKNPKTLSGGEAQLAALAAVLALNPEILLFDEATSYLDNRGVAAVQDCALSLKNEGKGIVMVEHDESRLKIADRILYIKDGFLRGELT